LSDTNVSHNIVRSQANATIVIEEDKSDVEAATRNERTALEDVDAPTPARKRHRRTWHHCTPAETDTVESCFFDTRNVHIDPAFALWRLPFGNIYGQRVILS